jgi:hypothetical protein
VLLPAIERYRQLDVSKFIRSDAAFANPALYRLLEEGREARLRSLKTLYWGGGSPGIGADSQNEKISGALDTAGGEFLLQ